MRTKRRKPRKQRPGGDSFYRGLLSGREIIQLFADGVYRADLATGRVFNSAGQEVATYPNRDGHLFVRLYGYGKRKAIAIHRVVWMVATGCPIPDEFEIHHWDEDNQSNAFSNLFCLHEVDHKKLHRGATITDEAAPF